MNYRDGESSDRGPLLCCLNGVLRGIDRSDGSILWESKLETNEVRMAVGPQRVYVAGRKLRCIERSSGQQHWVVDLREGCWTGLLVLADRVVVAGVGELDCYSLTGERLWLQRFKGGGYGELSVGVPGQVLHYDRDR
jgi:outer membrane protein assembly factor BamB